MTSRWQGAFGSAETIPDIGENAKPAHRFAVQQRLLFRLLSAYPMRLCANHSAYATMAAFGWVASR
jgi:hypothetical protein